MPTHLPAFYAHEKLRVGLESLTTGAGDVRERLLSAYSSFYLLNESHFPEHLREDYKWVMAQLTKHKPDERSYCALQGGTVKYTLSRIRNSTGVKIAEKLLFLYNELTNYLYPR